ncbi:hypothetical protein AVEN_251607-1 [Araneus ventricosus]|uniref:Uncharacterized protein n=1 Tax=Araneus ventricosus TaxID=182803 RepID=A0A4Y2EVD0_ARAVE|nr:hypothetical protein AVEN_251607-1 [Araneus ventricosus]
MALPFSEWSREAKDEFAQKRMEEMKLKNEALKQRYAEVEQDRIKAEAKDSAVTSLKVSKKENIVIEKEKEEDIPKVTKEREWDKGKIDQDADDWSPPKFHGYRSRAQRRNFPDRRAPKKEENWRVRSANVSKDRQSYSKFRSSGPNHKYQESSNYGTSGLRNENAGFSRQRGRAHRASSGTYRSFQNSRFDEPRKKSISGGAGSASPSLSDSEMEPVKHQSKPEIDRMWQDGGITEVQHKQSRVEKWVKAINTGSSWNEEYDNVKGNDHYPEKRGEAGPRDTVKSYGYANEEGYSKKAQSSRDQTHLKNRERYDGLKYGQSSRGNLRARGNRTPTGERTVGGFENKNQRDFRKRNYSDKNRFRRESDLSDRTSSMKESDYHDCSKDKFNKTTSDSKSSDYSGKWEDEECEFKYVSEKRPFDKQLGAHNYGKDEFSQPKNVQTSSVSSGQDGMKKDSLDDEYARNTRQKFPSSYVKDKSKTKNLRNTDHSGFGDQHLDNRSGARKVDYSFSKVKSNKFKTEPKFLGHSGKFENESTADNHARASRKYKMSKPSPKRTLSNPVKSVDTSSSASKTMEFNSPDEDVWGDYEDSGIVWNIEGNNDSQAERKSSLLEEEADVNKASQPHDSSTPVKTDCDTSSEKLFYQNSELKNDEVSGDVVPEELHNDSTVEQNIEVNEKEVLINLEGLLEKSGTDENSAGVAEDEKLQPDDLVNDKGGDNIVSTTCPDETTEVDCSGVTDDKHEDSNDSVEYSGDQNESEIKVQQPTSDVVSTTFDTSESKNPAEIVTNESKSSLPEVFVSEVQNSQGKAVQSTETEQTSSELPNNANLEHSDVEVAQKDISVNEVSSSTNTGCETPVEETVENPAENDNAEIVHSEIKASSSQSMNAAYSKDDSESALKSSDLVTAESQSPKHEGNENSSGALNLSDDGGWSTVSEDENNDVSDDNKNNQEGTSASKSEALT